MWHIFSQCCNSSYVITAPISRADFTYALYWDAEDPYHYVRPTAIEGDEKRWMLIVGGEDHDAGMELDSAAERYERLERWARERWPTIGQVEEKWSGQVRFLISILCEVL